MKRVLAIHLDAYEPTLGYEMMEAGEMPALKKLAGKSARFELDHGPALRTGLAGEHVATGLSPDDAKRWSAVHFDPETYEVWQEGTSISPFTSTLPVNAVVFDTPYFDLKKSPSVKGIVNWGAHDPGVAAGSRPDGLLEEVVQKFGAYPAKQWLYGLSWNSIENTSQAADSLYESIEKRGEIAEWLLNDRIKDWDLALISVSEAHSGIEGLWHGIDINHPLHSAPTSKIAAEGIRRIYRGIDKLVERLTKNIKDTTVILFSLHGMGSNSGDIASFLLLAEILYRQTYGKSYFNREGQSDPNLNSQVYLPNTETWTDWIRKGYPKDNSKQRSTTRKIVSSVTPHFIKHLYHRHNSGKKKFKNSKHTSVNWMPAAHYKKFWPGMIAFSIPSYYDGRVRINLRDREKQGIVPKEKYKDVCNELIKLISECKDPLTGEEVVDHVEYPSTSNPMELTDTEVDLVFVWKGTPTGFIHPKYGKIGPIPYRRTGGHTGGNGFAYVYGTKLGPQEYGTRSAYDVIPSILEILKIQDKAQVSGDSLLA